MCHSICQRRNSDLAVGNFGTCIKRVITKCLSSQTFSPFLAGKLCRSNFQNFSSFTKYSVITSDVRMSFTVASIGGGGG